MTEVMNNGMGTNGIVLFAGVVLLAVLVLLRNRPFIVLARVFRTIARPLGRIFRGSWRPLRRIFRPVISLLRALRIIPRTVSREGRNYVGPSAFSALIRAFRWKTESERELDKTEFMSRIAEEARKRALPSGKVVPLEEAASAFHAEYVRLSRLVDLAFEKAEGELAAARRNFDLLQKDPPEGYEKPEQPLDVKTIEEPLSREKEHLDRNGWFFKWLEPGAGYIRDEDMDWPGAVTNYFLSNIFFTYDIPVGTPRSGVRATNLYEDIEGACSVSMFGIKDRDVYYLFTQMRKVINGNVRRLAVWFSLIATAFFLSNVYIAGPVPAALSNLLGLESATTFLGIGVPGKTKFLLISFFISAVTMWLLYTAEYRHYVRNNGREMNNFLTRYMARLNDMYRQAERNARGVFAGEVDTAAADAEEHAQVWFANIQWIAFRAFYIEAFLRNTLYQIYRNSGYYVFLVPVLFVAGAFFLLVYTEHLPNLGNMFVWHGWSLNPDSLQTVLFSAALIALIMMVAYYLTHSLKDLEGTIRESEWFNFHHFELQRTTTNLIGRYGNEIRFWRERLRASEGRRS